MSYHFLGLVNDINRRLNEVELTTTNFASCTGFYSFAKDAVNSSLRDINTQTFEWPFNHDTQREQLHPGDVRYFIPREVKTLDMDSFRIVRDDDLGNATVKLRILSYEDYLSKFVDYQYREDESVRGLPQSVFRSPSLEFGVVPPPDKEYTIEYEYYRNPVPLNLHSDVPTVPSEFRNIVVDGAMSYVYSFRGDTESSQLSTQKFQMGLKSMRTLYINRYEYLRDTRISF